MWCSRAKYFNSCDKYVVARAKKFWKKLVIEQYE